MPTYRQILSKAWQLTWQNPLLWLFGLFVAMLGSGGEIEILLSSITLGQEPGFLISFFLGLASGGLFSLAGVKGIFSALFTNPFTLFVILLLMMVMIGIAVLLIWLIIVSQSALINGVLAAGKNKPLKWSGNFYFGLAKFWPVLILNALAKFIFWVLFAGLSLLVSLKFYGSIFFFIIAYVIFVLLILVISFIIKYAICGVVLNNYRVGEAIDEALKLFYKNWLLSLEVAVILFLVYVVASGLLALVLSIIFAYAVQLFHLVPLVLILVLVGIYILFILGQLLLAVFHWASWVLVFESLNNKKVVMLSRLISGFQRMFNR